MRKSLTSMLAVAAIALGFPTVGNAQSSGRSTTLIGQVVDAGGRGSSGRTVELVSDGVVVGTTTSTYTGQFMFAVGSAGSYVVRTMVNGHPAGIRVAVRAGENPPMALLVLPSTAAASYQGIFISTAINAAVSAASAGATITVSAVATQLAQKNDDELLSDPATQAQVIQVLQQIVQQLAPAGTTITFTPGQAITIPGLPPDLQQVVQAINAINTNIPAGSLGG
jgi:hypothetical protein